MTHRVTAILHGYVWPDQAAIEGWSALAATAFPGLQVVHAREDATHVIGAAALVNRAAAQASGELLLVAWPTGRWTAAQLTSVIDAAAKSGLAVADLQGEAALSECPLWAVQTELFRNLGGLDERLWSIDEVTDFAERAGARGTVGSCVPLSAETVNRRAYPFTEQLTSFLELRNRLLRRFKTAERDRLGPLLCHDLIGAFLASWRATGLQTSAFQFGAKQLETPLAYVRDAAGMLLPLLAIDSFMSEMPSLVGVRRSTQIQEQRCERDLISCLAELVGSSTAEKAGLEARSRGVARDLGRETPPGVAQGFSPEKHVSVIIVNWNGREHLEACFGSLEQSDYPEDRLELILVDNGSTDDSVEMIRRRFPRVKIVALERNLGFTGGNNAGVAASHGDVLVFFNNDMRVRPDAISALVGSLDGERPCAAARVLSWNGRRIDFIGGSVNYEARGFQDRYGEPAGSDAPAPETFFPNGGAFAITRHAYERAGGFDDRFFAYYDDVDLGWRLRLAGFGIRVVPDAVVYHRHGATSRKYPRGQKRFLMDRNALWTAIKNYEDRTLRRVLAPILLLAIRRIVQETTIVRSSSLARQLAPFSVRCRRPFSGTRWPASEVYLHAPQQHPTREVVRRMPIESLAAIAAAVEALPAVSADRQVIQERRAVSDEALIPRFGRVLESSSSLKSYRTVENALMDTFELRKVLRPRSRVLIITHEPLAANMSGPGVRALEIGRVLASGMAVTIATPYAPTITDERCRLAQYSLAGPAELRRLAEEADVILARGFTLEQYPFLKRMDVPIVVDLYCPFTLEHLEMNRARGVPAEAIEDQAAQILHIQNAQLLDGDFFICASERQRDLWIGALHASGRVNPRTYEMDPTLRRLIDVVPFGLPDEEAPRGTRTTRVMKGIRPGIREHDRVLLWAGSVLDWQDPQTLIRAVARLSALRDDVKLFFMGIRHPNPQVEPMRAIEESITLAGELGVLNTHVFFNDWVPYEERASYLLEADVGLSTHRLNLETRYSFRTRMLDYIWATLPIVCTTGDHFAALVEERGLGLTVPAGDIDALTSAIARLLDDRGLRAECEQNLRTIGVEMRWSRVVEPLRTFCAAPEFAPDRALKVGALRSHLESSYGFSKWLKRTALRVGVSEGQVEALKRLKAVRAGMAFRNRLARIRAERAVSRK